jgi:hypothetical protein
MAIASRPIAESDLARIVDAPNHGFVTTQTVEAATAAEEAAVFAVLTLWLPPGAELDDAYTAIDGPHFEVLGTIQAGGSPTITPMLRKPRRR